MRGASSCCSLSMSAVSARICRCSSLSSASTSSHGINRDSISDHFVIWLAAYCFGKGVQDLDCCCVTSQKLVVVLLQDRVGAPKIGNDFVLVCQPATHDA